MVDKRTLEKYEREAKERSRESWYLSWALDTNQEGKFLHLNFIRYKLFQTFYVIYFYFKFK